MMNKHIWKFTLQPDGALAMPRGAKVIAARAQYDNICLWAEVDVDAPFEDRQFSIYATGEGLPEKPGQFVDTVLLSNGSLVFHIYENGGRGADMSGGWQPIDTMPEMVDVLVYGGYPDRNAFVSIGTMDPDAKPGLRLIGWGINLEAGYRVQAWMPLPKPPVGRPT
jgi:hypothetical protein